MESNIGENFLRDVMTEKQAFPTAARDTAQPHLVLFFADIFF